MDTTTKALIETIGDAGYNVLIGAGGTGGTTLRLLAIRASGGIAL